MIRAVVVPTGFEETFNSAEFVCDSVEAVFGEGVLAGVRQPVKQLPANTVINTDITHRAVRRDLAVFKTASGAPCNFNQDFPLMLRL